MTDMLQAMKAGQTSSGMVQLAGGVEHIERIKPQPAPPPCPPGQAPIPCPPVQANAPMGPPIAVHEPAPGQREVIEVVPNQPLIFDFNPLDLKATQQDGSVTLTFPDGAQLELHDIVGPCGVQPTPFQLPDGTVITPGDLLQAFHLEVIGPCGLVAPTPIVPHHEVPNTGFAVGPFDVGELGPGLYGLGPLWPTGFGYGAEFLRGSGGSHFTPSTPGPPGPPPPPPGTPPSAIEDVQLGDYGTGGSTPFSYPIPIVGTGNYFTDINIYSPGQPIVTQGSAPAHIVSFQNEYTLASSLVGNAPVTLDGQYGALTFTSNLGHYSYDTTAHQAVDSQFNTDIISQNLNQMSVPNAQSAANPFVDTYNITISDGVNPDPLPTALQFDIYGADVASTAASFPTVGPTPGIVPAVSGQPTTLLLTYTDALDPAHSFQQVVTVDTSGGIHVAPESSTFVQPNDPALLSISYVSGADATVNTVNIEGVQFDTAGITLSGTPVAGISSNAFTNIVNPILNGLGDPGDTNPYGPSASGSLHSTDMSAALATLTSADLTNNYNDLNYVNAGGSTGHSENFGYLYDNNTGATTMTAVGSGATADVLAINGLQTGATTIIGSDAPNASNVIVWQSNSYLDDQAVSGDNLSLISGLQIMGAPELTVPGSTGYDANYNNTGSNAAGLNTLQIESQTGQDLVFSRFGDAWNPSAVQNLSSGVDVQNIEVFDLTDAAGAPVNTTTGAVGATPVNSIALSVQDVLNLAGNEPTSIPISGGGALAVWVLGNNSDQVTLNGGTWTAISGPVTSGGQMAYAAPTFDGTTNIPVNASNNTQMVGFTEYSSTLAAPEKIDGQKITAVHVYVENAIVQNHHVAHT